ncbi:MAG: alginate export family protein [Pirellulales bacterium]|nr:alginate export family protein [Pirellulales bacterium]
MSPLARLRRIALCAAIGFFAPEFSQGQQEVEQNARPVASAPRLAPLPEPSLSVGEAFDMGDVESSKEGAVALDTELNAGTEEELVEPASNLEALDHLENLDAMAPQGVANPTAGGSAEAEKPPAKKKPTPPPPPPFKGVFYDNDFEQLSQDKFYGHRLKRWQLGDCTYLDFGGEYRARYHNESNLRGTNFSNTSDEFLLHRVRLYANAEIGELVRLYAEALDAQSNYEDFPPRVIEENRFDAQNLFGDLLLYNNGEGKYKARVGRQELIYGEQRLISPLDWANTRRTFDGAKIWYASKEWNMDGFWVRPVPASQHVNGDRNFDSADDSQEFIGLYTTYKGKKDQTYDFYFLRFAEYEGPGTQFFPVDYDPMLFAMRWSGKQLDYFGDGSLFWDCEGGYQFGDFGQQTQSAGFATAGLGRDWSKRQYKPKLMLYYDYASGDQDPNDAVHGTFFQYFGLVHRYFGFMDLVARQNIHDINLQLTLATGKKSTFLIWHHIFFLDSPRDALYNAGGTPILFDPTGNAGSYVGQELDLTWQYNFNPNTDVLFGYSHFFAGDFVKNLRPVGNELDFTYVQFTVRF